MSADHRLVHYSRKKLDELRPLTYEELTQDRTSGRWADRPDLAAKYVEDRRRFEKDLHKRLAARGITTKPDTSFLYATLSGHERFGVPEQYKHEAELTPELINSSFFDVVGAGKGRTAFGQKGLLAALKKWKEAEKANALKEQEYMGMVIRPRIEVITPNSLKPIHVSGSDLIQSLAKEAANTVFAMHKLAGEIIPKMYQPDSSNTPKQTTLIHPPIPGKATGLTVKKPSPVLNEPVKRPKTLEFTQYPNINPIYPRVKFGPIGDPKKVVQPALRYADYSTESGDSRLNPEYQTVEQGVIPPSFGNVSKNLVEGLLPNASKDALDDLKSDFYLGDTRGNFYDSLDKTLNVPNSQQQTNKNIEDFRTSLKNMARWAGANRVNRPTGFSTEPNFGGGADPNYLEPTYSMDGKPDQSLIAPYSTTGKPLERYEKYKKERPKEYGILQKMINVSPSNSVFLHELEHTNQARAPKLTYSFSPHVSNFEMPAVLSEIAHQAAAAHEATGKYPRGNFYGVPYSAIAREAQRRGHVYGNIPMTELLKTPEAQKWLDQLVKSKKY